MADTETGLNNKKEHVVLPSDLEEARATLEGKNYVRMRSGPVKVYTKEEIEIFSKNHPESNYPFTTWLHERRWNQILDSDSAKIKGRRQ